MSSKYRHTYKKACELTEKLLNSVYEQYYKYLASKKTEIRKLKIKKSENTFTRKHSASSNGSKYNRQGDFQVKPKYKSDSKKQYNQVSPLMTNNFDTYGFDFRGMGNIYPTYCPPPASHNQRREVGGPFHPNANFLNRKLFSDAPVKAPGQDPLRGNSQPDFSNSG